MVMLVLPSPRGHHMLIYYVKKLAGDFCVPGQGPDSVVAAVPIWTPGPNLREPDSPENQDESSNDHSSASATGSSQERKGVIPSRDPPGWLLGDATTEPGPSGACDGFFPAAVMPPPAAEASQVYCLPVVKVRNPRAASAAKTQVLAGWPSSQSLQGDSASPSSAWFSGAVGPRTLFSCWVQAKSFQKCRGRLLT